MAQTPLTFVGRVEGVFVCDQPVRSTARDEIQLMPEGIRGDRHTDPLRLLKVYDKDLLAHGLLKGMLIAPTRQVSIVSVEELAAIGRALETCMPIPPEALGANILISGIPDLTLLPPGTLLCFSRGDTPRTAVVGVWEINNPCSVAGQEVEAATSTPRIASRFVTAAMDRRGLVGFVMSSGVIKKGDTVTARIPRQWLYGT